MGVVYAAHDDTMDRPVAIKVLMGDLEGDPESRARFHREAQAAAGLLHPNIITIYDAGEDQGRSFIAMQLLEGWPLAAYLKRPEAQPLERKVDLMLQICDGLVAAHGRGIVHRDLKPGNLFVQVDGVLKILDFGVARLADSSMTATGMMLGTPDYMSPEQARGTPVDARSDIFSAGAVAYFMLAGRKPFPGPDLPAVLRQLQFEEPAPLEDAGVPAELARIVRYAMAKAVVDRPSRIQDLHTALVRFRRAHQAETRRLSGELRSRAEAAADAEAALVQVAAALDLTPPREGSSVLSGLRERVVEVIDGGPGADAAGRDRTAVRELLAEVEAEQHRLEGEARLLSAHVRRLDEAEQARRAGDARGALRLVEEVCRDVPSSARARALAGLCAREAQEQEARDRRVEELAGEARAALQRGEWARAAGASEEALALAPGAHEVRALQHEAQERAALEERSRALRVQQALDRADVLTTEGRFGDAEAALGDAAAVSPDAPALAAARARLAAARAAAEEIERVRRQIEVDVRRARAAFARGRYDEAVAQLRDLARRHPASTEAAGAASRLSALRNRLDALVRERRARAASMVAAARALAGRGALADAVTQACEAVACDGSDPDAAALLDELLERDFEARVERERQLTRERRSSVVEPLAREAREARVRGYAAVALDLAETAARLAADRGDLVQMVAELRETVASPGEGDVDLHDEPFAQRDAPGPQEASEASSPAAPGQERGVLGQVNQWLWKRLPNR